MRLQGWSGPALLSCLLATGPAYAQSPAPPPPSAQGTKSAPSVVLPHVKTQPDVAYPEQALKDGVRAVVTVGLTIEIDAEGTVRKATVDAPQGHGFDEAAVAAAEKSTFEPARRDGVAFAAKVRFALVFHPPEDVTPPDPTPDKAPPTTGEPTPNKAPPTTKEPLQPVVDVEVRGERERRDVTKRTLTMQEIALIPGTNGDALESLQSLPGVARPPFASVGQLIVRGSAPGDTGYMVDGTPVPIVYHFGGLASVLPTEVLSKIDFYPGNYSAAYGRGMGGLVDVGIRAPRTDGPHVMAQVDLLDARILAESPVFKTGWNVFAAARRSWYDVWLTPILSAANAGTTAVSRYYDYQAMLQKDLTPRSSFRLLFFGSDDEVKLLQEDPNAATVTTGFGYHQSFWRLQARYEHRLSDRTEIRAVLAGGQDATDSRTQLADFESSYHVTEAPVSARVELTQKVRPGVIANVGFDVLAGPYDLRIVNPLDANGVFLSGPGQKPTETKQSGFRAFTASYTEWEIRLWRGMRVVPGLRLDYSSSTKSWDLSPRIVLRQDVTRTFPRTTVKGGVGLFYQPPATMETNPVFGQLGLKSNRSIHTDIGMEQELSHQVELSLDVYYKKLDDLVVEGAGNSGVGVAYGAEWLLRYKPDERFFGWIAYTLSRSERRWSDAPGARSAQTDFDQTHNLTVLGSYQLPYGFRAGLRFRLVSGNPYTPISPGLYNATVGYQELVRGYPRNSARLPLFHQLDLRVDKKFQFKSWALSGYLDLQNVYNQQNVEGLIYNFDSTQQANVYGLPIVASVGIRGEL
ncbi:MAG: TonB family protein [Polyangiaceae bacterium]